MVSQRTVLQPAAGNAGVVGGIAGAALLSAAAFAFVVRRRTGHWPLTKGAKAARHPDRPYDSDRPFDSDQGAPMLASAVGVAVLVPCTACWCCNPVLHVPEMLMSVRGGMPAQL